MSVDFPLQLFFFFFFRLTMENYKYLHSLYIVAGRIDVYKRPFVYRFFYGFARDLPGVLFERFFSSVSSLLFEWLGMKVWWHSEGDLFMSSCKCMRSPNW